MVDTIRDVERIFWRELSELLKPSLVRIGWQTNGAPDWKIDEDVLFINVLEDSVGDITQNIDELLEPKTGGFGSKRGMTRVLKLQLVAYGAHSYINLVKLRNALYKGRPGLRKEKLFLIPDTGVIRRVPELFQGRWWERADMDLSFNWLVVFDSEISNIEAAEIALRANRPLESDVVRSETIKVRKDE